MEVVIGLIVFVCIATALTAYACCIIAGKNDCEIELYSADNSDSFEDYISNER